MYDINNKNNFMEYIEKNLTIRSKNRNLDSFICNKEQKAIIDKIQLQYQKHKKVRLIILKGRQIGTSTLIAARGYYNLINNKGYRAMLLAHRQSATNNMFDIAYRYLNYDSNMNKKDFSVNKNKSILLKNQDSSYVFATAGSTEVGRSDTIQFFHGSEVAYWNYEENHLSSILMAVPDSEGSEIILESTSNGPKGMFYNLCQEALKGEGEFEIIFFPWFYHQEYQSDKNINLPQAWLDYGARYQLTKAQINWAYFKNKTLSLGSQENDFEPCDRFYREFPASIGEAFKYSQGNIFIKIENIQKLALAYNFYKQNNVALKIAQHKYMVAKNAPIIIGVDVARGGGDYSWIIDRQGEFIGFNVNNKIDVKDTMELVGWLVKYIEQLNPILVCLDAGGGGVGVYDRLKELGFGNILVLVHFAAKADDGRKYLNKRAEMWGRLKNFVEQDGCGIINDELLLQQIASVEYFYNSKGQIQLEAKDNIKKKLKHSPDGADACALTFAKEYSYSGACNFAYKPIENNNFDPFRW